MLRGQFKQCYLFFADRDSLNIAGNCRIIWKDLWWRTDSYRLPDTFLRISDPSNPFSWEISKKNFVDKNSLFFIDWLKSFSVPV